MKIVITGGHLAPALGLIDSLSKQDSVIFIGRKYALEGDKSLSLEYIEISKRNISFLALTTGRFQRNFSTQTIPSLSRMPRAVLQATSYLRRIKPDVVLSFGGYLSVPVGLAAKILGIPLVIHEQTLEAGLANKILTKIATKICISWENSRSFFPEAKVVLTGNPLKKFIKSQYTPLFSASDQNLPLLYVTGGSTGSHAINKLIEEEVVELTNSFCVVHQTGGAEEFSDYERLVKIQASLPLENRKRYVVYKYISSEILGGILESASIVFSRSGINTVSELIFFGKPALLIPLPHGQKNEQLKNARFLEELGLAEVVLQKNATAQVVSTKLLEMSSNLRRYKEAAREARGSLREDPAREIYETLSYVVKKKSS